VVVRGPKAQKLPHGQGLVPLKEQEWNSHQQKYQKYQKHSCDFTHTLILQETGSQYCTGLEIEPFLGFTVGCQGLQRCLLELQKAAGLCWKCSILVASGDSSHLQEL
jgi:hypothetical protein